jgi:hypothetical protein
MPTEPPKSHLQVPRSALQFAVPVRLAAAEPGSNQGRRRFNGVAYAGGVITDHGWWAAVAFDLAGLKAAAPMPVLLQHEQSSAIGVIDDLTNDGQQLTVGGWLFTDIDEQARAVAAKADAGLPWQMSVGIFPDAVEEIAAGATVTVNGRAVTGSAHVFRRSRVRETSFVVLGADGATRAAVFDADPSARVAVPLTSSKGALSMTDTDKQAFDAAQAQAAAEKARADKLATDLAALQEQFSARDKAERESKLKALWGDDFTADKAAPFLAMQPEQFSAALGAIESVRAKLPAEFTTELATSGSKPGDLAASPLLASARQMFNIKPA